MSNTILEATVSEMALDNVPDAALTRTCIDMLSNVIEKQGAVFKLEAIAAVRNAYPAFFTSQTRSYKKQLNDMPTDHQIKLAFDTTVLSLVGIRETALQDVIRNCTQGSVRVRWNNESHIAGGSKVLYKEYNCAEHYVKSRFHWQYNPSFTLYIAEEKSDQ